MIAFALLLTVLEVAAIYRLLRRPPTVGRLYNLDAERQRRIAHHVAKTTESAQ